MIMVGTSESGPALARRMDLTSTGPVTGCMLAAAITISGTLATSMASVGLS
jgi:hypothetical protein